MTTETLERGNTALEIPVNPETGEYDEYYWEDYDLYHSEKFREAMHEAMAEADDIIAHPEKYKFYTSTKEMFRDMGLDVSNIPDR
ncbi:MAG: hypothetical protein IJS28_04295 [Synergistaceae bacterium]|nr:hypothetical protein [Synergistaceae bacterium]